MSEPSPLTKLALPPETLRLQSVAGWQGVDWIRRAFRVFARHPMGFAGLFCSSMLMMMLLLLTPLIGALLVMMSMPWLSLGFMVATRRALQGERPLVSAFLAPSRTTPSRVNQMLLLSVSYTLSAVVLMILAHLVDGDVMGPLVRQALSDKGDPQALAQDPRFQSAMLMRMALGAGISLLFWHAPALVYWGGQSWGRALVFNAVALWRNKVAFLIYGSGWGTLMMTWSVACSALLVVPGVNSLLPIGVPLSMTLLVTVFHLSTYFSFAACFSLGEPQVALPSQAP